MCQIVITGGDGLIASECVFCRYVHLVRDSAYLRPSFSYLPTENKQRISYRFDDHFSTLEVNDTFITRLNHTKQRFSSPGTIMAKYWSAMAYFVESFGRPAPQRRAKTDHARCEIAQKRPMNVAKMVES